MTDSSMLEDGRIVEAVKRIETAAKQCDDGAPIVQAHFRRGRDDNGGYVLVEITCKFKFNEKARM